MRTTGQSISLRVDFDDLSVLNSDQTRIGQRDPKSSVFVFDTFARYEVRARHPVGLTPRSPITQARDSSGVMRTGHAAGLRMSCQPVAHGHAQRTNGQKPSIRPAHDLVINQKHQQTPARVLSQISRIEARQSLLLAIARKATLVITNDAAILSTGPQIAASIF